MKIFSLISLGSLLAFAIGNPINNDNTAIDIENTAINTVDNAIDSSFDTMDPDHPSLVPEGYNLEWEQPGYWEREFPMNATGITGNIDNSDEENENSEKETEDSANERGLDICETSKGSPSILNLRQCARMLLNNVDTCKSMVRGGFRGSSTDICSREVSFGDAAISMCGYKHQYVLCRKVGSIVTTLVAKCKQGGPVAGGQHIVNPKIRVVMHKNVGTKL
ncbi:hypothetical protein EDC01DRAFT_746805 [Geopyxis carbonaria]|nr:hypothetical protein EDC01DRAFT_746805 [Geopyxis carbonaria]